MELIYDKHLRLSNRIEDVTSQRDLNEYKHYSHTILWNPISKGLENVKKAFKLGVKDLWGALKYAYNITVETDEEKIKKLKTDRKDTLNKLASEYKSLWGDIVETNGDFATFAMLAAPGPYFAAHIALNGRANLIELHQFCKNAGIPSETIERFLGNPPESPDDAEYIKQLMLRRNTSGSQRSEIEEVLQSVLKKISKIMQIENTTVSEYAGVHAIRKKLLQEKNNQDTQESSSPSDELLKGYIRLFQSDEFAKAIGKKIDNKKILKAKQEELDAYVNALNTPLQFISMIENAKDLQEVSAAYKTLGNSILKIDGLDNTDPTKKMQAVVDETYQKIKNDEKVKNSFIKGAQIKFDPKKQYSDEQKEEFVKAAIMKMTSAKQLEQIKEVMSGEEVQKSLELAREEFIKSFTDGLDDKLLSSMKKIDPTFPDFIAAGVEKIKNAGLLKK